MNDNPICGKCSVVMTPENSKDHPELFLCDRCARAFLGLPAEPDSGIQEHIHELELDNGFTCRCGYSLKEKDAPSDHVEHVRQNELECALREVILAAQEVLSNAHYDIRYGAGDLNYAMNHGLKILSEHRSSSPVASVSAEPDSAKLEEILDRAMNEIMAGHPGGNARVRYEFTRAIIRGALTKDSAPWTVENPKGPFVDGGVWANGKLLCVCENQFQAVEVCDAHNATLPAPRSGSEVSGVAEACEHLRVICVADVSDMESRNHNAPAMKRRAQAALELLAPTLPSPAPSAPSSTEQKEEFGETERREN